MRCRAANDGNWAEVGGVKPDGLVRSGEVEDIVYTLNEPMEPLAVTKTAETSFTRTWSWTIDKGGDQTELTLAAVF